MVFDALREVLRESALPDRKFLQDLVYYFELRVPSRMVTGCSPTFLFPLVLGPESYSLTEPFALVKSQTQGSGLFVEENGIIERTIRLRGHTGFRPRKSKASTGFSLIQTPEAGRSFARDIRDPLDDISGQKHFQFLQDAVFRTYADLKRDPSTSADTQLHFHIPREDEHWEVKPVSFALDRSLEKRNLYYYDIELLVVGPSKDIAHNFSEDKNLLDTIKDGLHMAQSAIDLVRGGLADIVNLVNDIARTIKGFSALINSITSILDTAADFVNGVAAVIRAPFNVIADISNKLDTSLQAMVTSTRTFPDSIVNAVRQMKDGIARLGSFPDHFETGAQHSLETIRRGESLSTSRSIATLQAAAAETPPNSFQKVLALGTANTVGDLSRSKADLEINRQLAVYQSTTEIILHRTDTLHSLAARYLGDSRLYKHIAAINSLDFPFVSEEGIPGTLKSGDRILIPSRERSPDARPIVAIFGVVPSASAEDRLLGTDFMFERVDGPGDLFDFVVDEEGGSTDLKTVSGIPNLEQALLSRVRTERGTDQLYHNVGVDRIIGLPIPALGPDIAGINVSQAIQADPRVNSIRRLTISQPSPDTVDLDFDVEIIGISKNTPINLSF